MEEKYIMFSMEDERIKQLSEALSNPSCKRILNLLSEKELTETDIARELKVPLNTVDYNIKKLISTGLIEKTSHFWSVRGKKMPVYKVSNRKIIISPNKSNSLVGLMVSVVGSGILALGIKKYLDWNVVQNDAVLMARDSFLQSPAMAEKTASVVAEIAVTGFAQWQWFLFGAWVGILLFFAISLISERRKNGKTSKD